MRYSQLKKELCVIVFIIALTGFIVETRTRTSSQAQTGTMQKIIDVNITGEVHLITRAPQSDEMWGTPRMKELKQK